VGNKKIDRKGFILLLLYVKGRETKQPEPIRGRTRLAKLLFLLKEEQWGASGLGNLVIDYYEFHPDNYGPFDREIFNDIEFLRSVGLIDVTNIQQLPGEEVSEYLESLKAWSLDNDLIEEIFALEEQYFEQEIFLTELGVSFVKQRLVFRLNEKQLEAFRFVKSNYGNWPLSSLLRYIYATYPKMATKSKIRQRILTS
jgi:uncharacterized protein YwgA